MTLPLLFGPYGSAAVEHIDRFPQANINALWFHGFDPAAFETCQKHGIAACVEFKTFRADFAQRPDLVPIGTDGKPIRYGELVQGVCLSRHDYLDETEAALIAGLKQFEPTGVWFDYLTYAGWFETPTPDLQDSCFCPDCIREFCQSTGIDADTSQAILSQHAAAWTRHKCERVARYAAHYAGLVRSLRPGCVTGAYMCPWTPEEFDHALTRIFAQDYSLLAPAIDIFTPLIYCTKSGRPQRWGRDFLEASPRFVPAGKPVQLILDVLEYPDSLLETAHSTIPSLGIQLFGGKRIFEDPEQVKLFAQAVEKIRAENKS
ncbi:MAG: hypothetical protein JW987_11780 [Anaerolineaceae bacterium]|nr:hypothetical protein [Anaerolineaceae bacterium]